MLLHASCCKSTASLFSMVMPMDMAGILPGRVWAVVEEGR
jgi:hypothetical protein